MSKRRRLVARARKLTVLRDTVSALTLVRYALLNALVTAVTTTVNMRSL